MILQALLRKSVLPSKNINFIRYLRGIVPRSNDLPKRLKGKIETILEEDEPTPTSYKDLIKSLEDSNLGNEIDVEQQFLHDDYYGDVIERCDMYYSMHEKEQKGLKSRIKKNIIGRKYFKLDLETNLLTYAAKEQIRYLHNLNPLEWNCKALSECFPISEAGAKKLLKCNYRINCPEKIKLHDEEVARRWQILKSGKPTDEISPLTQKLYKEGKLIDDYFSGNPNLPTAKPQNKKVIEKKRAKVGEFSAIVKTYLDYQNQKLIESGETNSDEKQISLRDPVTPKMFIPKYVKKIVNDDRERYEPQVCLTRLRKNLNNDEIPFSRFKEILNEETSMKNSKYNNEYDAFVKEETSKKENTESIKPQDSQDCFLKIPKYNRSESVEVMYENDKMSNTVYTYDEKLGYQYPVGKNIRGRINIRPKQQHNRKLHKVGKSIYDADGEFLYNLP